MFRKYSFILSLFLVLFKILGVTDGVMDDIRAVKPVTYCKFQPNAYDCTGKRFGLPRFYFDLKMQACKTSSDGGCDYNYNAFGTLLGCSENCLAEGQSEKIPYNMTANIYCRLQPDFGKCHGYISMYYFDVTLRSCRGFAYSGCGGNLNRFSSQQVCTAICLAAVDYHNRTY